MTKDEALKMALEALEDAGKDDFWRYQDKAITAIKEALAQPEPKYHRGNRLICLETEEYCVIHVSGTNRQWVKFPDSYIGVYTNEQVAELFELLPKEPEPWEKFCDSNCVWSDHHPDCKLAEQEPVAWRAWVSKFPQGAGSDWVYVTNPIMKDRIHNQPLYTTPPQRTWVGLSDEEILQTLDLVAYDTQAFDFAYRIEAKLKEKNT